jgi:lipoprotein-releasing system permease protein
LSFALSQVRFEIPDMDLTSLPLAWSMWHYLIASAFALVAAGVAGYLPARRASRLNPVDIIRGAT